MRFPAGCGEPYLFYIYDSRLRVKAETAAPLTGHDG